MLINELPLIMCKCLFFTIIIELVIACILKVKKKKDILNIVLVNIMTNPLVTSIPTFVYMQVGTFGRNLSLIILEVFAVLSEGFVYKKFLNFKKINPYIFSIILNVSSFLIGEIINKL